MTLPRPESWQGPAADRMNERAAGPQTPALKNLVGQAPMVYVTRVPDAAERDEPAWELQLCTEKAVLHVVCASRDHLQLGNDHCREHYPALGKEVDAVVAALEAHSDLASWIGEPTRRLGCMPGSRDLSPHELAQTIRADLAEPRTASR
jgi:hypothetical protein